VLTDFAGALGVATLADPRKAVIGIIQAIPPPVG
jgi:hypothetical protein